MGFSICYRSTRPVSPAEAAAINRTAEAACQGYTWLSCESLLLSIDDEDSHLHGSSKPNFHPHFEDVVSAANERLPDGTVRNLLEVLCRISREHSIDWEISHDYSDGPIGYIRAGVCDADVQTQIEIFADVAEELSNLRDDKFFDRDMNDEDEDDEGPSILPFRPKSD